VLSSAAGTLCWFQLFSPFSEPVVQFKWLQQLYPRLFDVVKGKIADGAFQPIGGTWVEMCVALLASGGNHMRGGAQGHQHAIGCGRTLALISSSSHAAQVRRSAGNSSTASASSSLTLASTARPFGCPCVPLETDEAAS
jgi:hypothetical protein